MGEVWKDVVGFEKYYQVSNLGRVKALEVTRIDSLGRKTTYKDRIFTTSVVGWDGVKHIGKDKEGKKER